MKATTTLMIILIVAISIIAPLNRGDDLIEMGGWLVMIPLCFILLGYFSKSIRTGIFVGLSVYFFLIVGYWDSVVEYGFWDSISDDGAVFYPIGYAILSTISALYSSQKSYRGRPDETRTYDDKTRIY
ncbi:MAG: hypothetical protein HXS48_09795 [Theionarchaea archaeon]|nr:MAG: hypothetical protein AYK19_10590 [Theionarchaea archaeon DG-70-1]MBU7027224.1 hypothetical protein [Theionarchaea archaeon]